MWIDSLNPVLLRLGGLEVRYYGLVYVLGFFLAVGWLFYLKKKEKLELNGDEIWDLMFYLMLGVLIGSRLFMIFWEPGTYLVRPWELLMVWHGGMSFHGGLVGIVLACWLYCKKKKLDFMRIADFLSLPAMFALALGRIANFINGELVGRIWNGPWCVVFPNYGAECRHPNMIYSAVQRFLVFGGLLWLYVKNHHSQTSGMRNRVSSAIPLRSVVLDHTGIPPAIGGRNTQCFKEETTKFKPGFIFWNLVFWEGIGRIIMDFFREDILYLGFSLGQWFSLGMVLVALGVFVRTYGEDWEKLWKK